jgi:hypothetical protein
MAHKYNAQKVTDDGIIFDSKLEHKRYLQLKTLQAAGAIRELEVHKTYVLIDKEYVRGKPERAVKHELDFDYFDVQEKRRVVEEIKGVRTAVWVLKRRLFVARYPQIDYRVLTKDDI